MAAGVSVQNDAALSSFLQVQPFSTTYHLEAIRAFERFRAAKAKGAVSRGTWVYDLPSRCRQEVRLLLY